MAEYKVKRGDSLSRIARDHELTLNQLLAMNPRCKANPDRIAVGDRIIVPDKAGKPVRPPEPEPAVLAPEPEPPGPEAGEPPARDWFKVPLGQLTFNAEGIERLGSKYHSRVPHVPGRWSGVTIGRGYDMGQRSRDGIRTDLRQAGMTARVANRLASCSGFIGSRAKAHIDSPEFRNLEITPEQQHHLFLDTYEELAGDVIRICTKLDVVDKYGATDWDGLDPVIRDIAVDLRYRGDYTPSTRTRVQPVIVANSRTRLRTVMADEDYWRFQRNVPKDRFDRRRKYVENA